MISNKDITFQTGLQERRLFQLAKTQSEKELISLIALQITDLIEFLGMQGEMTAKQIFDTAEFISSDFDNLSLRALQHCFNLVKKSKPPFNKPLYNKITGRKILDWLNQYDKMVDEYIFSEANSKIYSDSFRTTPQKKTDKGLLGMAGAISELKSNVKKLKLPKQNNK